MTVELLSLLILAITHARKAARLLQHVIMWPKKQDLCFRIGQICQVFENINILHHGFHHNCHRMNFMVKHQSHGNE